jgi:hypothetical protein
MFRAEEKEGAEMRKLKIGALKGPVLQERLIDLHILRYARPLLSTRFRSFLIFQTTSCFLNLIHFDPVDVGRIFF